MGLAAIKDLTEDGFDVTGYEARSHVGGLWKYSTDSSISVAANTIFNTSKYRLAFSDFPPSDDMDDFPMADKVYEYIDAYADHFNLKPKVRLDSRVEQVRRAGHKWAVETKGGSTDYYDKVVISIGTFLEPKKPSLRGIDKFEGTVLHSKDFHDPAKYAGNRVLILGVHASAIDVATGLADYTSKIYMAHRHGLLILPRFSPDGRTFDQSQSLRMVIILNAFMTYFPALFGWFLDKALSSMSKKAYNIPESWGFSPAPSITRQTPVIGDEIYPLLNSGRVDPVLAVEQMIGPKTIELKDGRVLQDIDAIIYCTGYCSTLDILEEKYDPFDRKNRDHSPRLFHNIFPLAEDPAVRNSLAFIGLAGTLFPGFVQWELIGMVISQTWKGNSPLPPLPEMVQWYEKYLDWRRKTVKGQDGSNFYQSFTPINEHLEWLDRTAGCGVWDHFGGWCSGIGCCGLLHWKCWKLWWQDRELYRLCTSANVTPAIWRLFDTGKRKSWAGARDEIFKMQKRINEGKRKRLQSQ